MIQQTTPRTQARYEAPSANGPGDGELNSDDRRRAVRARVAKAVLTFGVAATLAAGAWGVFSSLGAEAAPARVGETVEVPGGLVRVDAVAPERMAAMQADKFAASGMNMSSMGMDMAPEGQRRFTVDVALAAEGDALSYSPDDFRITGEGMEDAGPIRDTLEGGTVPAGGAVSGSLVFQVPEEAEGLELGFDGGRSVALDLPPLAEDGGHGHDDPAKKVQEGGHDH